MSYFNNPLPRTGLPRFHEASSLRSLRDSDVTARVWQKTKTHGEQGYRTAQAVEQLQRQLNRLRRRKSGGDSVEAKPYPFKIYRSPANPDWTPEESVDRSWRTFRVRAGKVGVQDVWHTDGGETPVGTPPATVNGDPNYDPDNAVIPAWIGSPVDFAVTDGEQWAVWLDCTDMDEPFVNAGGTAPAAGWWTGLYVPVGFIDCQTYAAYKRAVIRQLRRQDVPLASGCDGAGNSVNRPL